MRFPTKLVIFLNNIKFSQNHPVRKLKSALIYIFQKWNPFIGLGLKLTKHEFRSLGLGLPLCLEMWSIRSLEKRPKVQTGPNWLWKLLSKETPSALLPIFFLGLNSWGSFRPTVLPISYFTPNIMSALKNKETFT